MISVGSIVQIYPGPLCELGVSFLVAWLDLVAGAGRSGCGDIERLPKRTMAATGAVAQLGERQLCKLDVTGSSPVSSTDLDLLSRSFTTEYEWSSISTESRTRPRGDATAEPDSQAPILQVERVRKARRRSEVSQALSCEELGELTSVEPAAEALQQRPRRSRPSEV